MKSDLIKTLYTYLETSGQQIYYASHIKHMGHLDHGIGACSRRQCAFGTLHHIHKLSVHPYHPCVSPILDFLVNKSVLPLPLYCCNVILRHNLKLIIYSCSYSKSTFNNENFEIQNKGMVFKFT